VLTALVERRADHREFAVDGLGRNSFQLTHPVVWQQHSEEGHLTAESSAVMREAASEDCSVPPANALGIHTQRGLPERSLRVVQDAGEFVAEGLPGLLWRKTPSLVEPRLLAVTEATS
jgi:hypothetical protein